MKIRILVLFTVVSVLFPAWDNPKPVLFLVGDSISIHYTPYLKQYLGEAVLFDRKQDDGNALKDMDVPSGANGGDSRMVLEYLRARLKEKNFAPDLLLLNSGLHDIKRNTATGTIQVSEKEYRENLEEIVVMTRNRNIGLMWITTTPVIDTIHNVKQRAFQRYSNDLQAYNAIADEVCTKYDIPVIDLFSFTQNLGIGQFIDHVHYNLFTRQLQAAFIAGSVNSFLSTHKK